MSLALTFRPNNLDEILGQNDLVEVFKRFIAMQKLPHSLFFGVAGSGKTSFARVVAKEFGLDFYEFDGGNFKLEELRKILENYKNSLYKPLIFIDEIHRLSKTQQEMLLIPMENYRLILIGASTENPYFVLSQGIRSRSMLFHFKALGVEELELLLKKVQKNLNFTLDDDAKDTHYLLASALIKSLRGSDVDAALYYLARLIDGGESADFIARRLVIFASEDIGNADSKALILATSTLEAVKNIGYPEARIILAQCVIYLASAMKSNSSYKAINEALHFVRNNPPLPIPAYLNNNAPQSKDYLYPHDFGGYVEQKYLSQALKFYYSKGIGEEKILLENLRKLKSN